MTETIANGRYRVLETLHADDLQIVKRCKDTTVGREVLIEGPGPGLQAQASTDESCRSVREARALGRLEHPSIQRLLDVVEDDAGPLLVLEAIAGETLASRLEREGPLTTDEVVELGRHLAEALEVIHRAGIVHRSLAPENLLLPSSGGVRLRGFRLAKPIGGDGTGLDCGPLALTSLPYEAARSEEENVKQILPRYPAPEQVWGEAACERTDLFGLGCVLYLAATGEEAFEDLLRGGAPQRAVPLARAVPGAPPALARVIDSCIAWSPLDRPTSAAEVRDALARCSPGIARGAATWGRPLVGGLVVILGLALGAWFRWGGSAEQTQLTGRGLEYDPPPSADPTAPVAYSSDFARSYALLIGIGEYEDPAFPRLPNAEADVRDIAGRLADLPREWTLVDDGPLLGPKATRAAIERALDDLLKVLEPNDRVLLYFAGHGERRDGQTGWMIPTDGKEGDVASWVLFNTLDNFLRDARAKHVLVALDCCYAGRLAEVDTKRSTPTALALPRYAEQEARVVLCSGRDEPVSDGKRGQNSPFAQAFLEALDADRDFITSTWLYAKIQTVFDERQLLDQTPIYARQGSAAGEFIFVLR